MEHDGTPGVTQPGEKMIVEKKKKFYKVKQARLGKAWKARRDVI